MFRSAFLVLVAVLSLAAPASAERRVALVIGNGAYVDAARLPNPPNDAQAVAALLTELGFAVRTGFDLGRDGMEDAVADFEEAAVGAEVAFVFFAGHGMQVDGANFLFPVDARLDRRQDLYRLLDARRLVEAASRARRLAIVLLDACRDNPLARSFGQRTRSVSVGRGLTTIVDTPPNVLVAYATADGATAEDGVGRHSPFTAALLEHLPSPGVELRLLFGRIRDAVIARTQNRQQPYIYGSLGGDPFYIKPPVSVPSVSPAMPFDERALDLAFWDSIRDSDDVADYEAYLRQFPEGTFAALAQGRTAALAPASPVTTRPDAGAAGTATTALPVLANRPETAGGSKAGAAPSEPPTAGVVRPQEMQQAVAAIRRAVRGMPCVRIETAGDPGSMEVMVAAADGAAGDVVREHLDGLGWQPSLAVATLNPEAIACRVFEAINATTVPALPRFLRLDRPVDGTCEGAEKPRCYAGLDQAELYQGERLVLVVARPPGRDHLLVDYFMSDGNVVHLHPARRSGGSAIEAADYWTPVTRREIVIGDDRAGPSDPNEYPVAPPFGQELLVAIGTAAPAFTADRPFIEPAAAYLSDLRRTLAGVPGGEPPIAASLWIATRAREPQPPR